MSKNTIEIDTEALIKRGIGSRIEENVASLVESIIWDDEQPAVERMVKRLVKAHLKDNEARLSKMIGDELEDLVKNRIKNMTLEVDL